MKSQNEAPKPILVMAIEADDAGVAGEAAVRSLFPGAMPVDGTLVVSGLLAVLESFVLGQTRFKLIESELRGRWETGPCPEQVGTGMLVLRQFGEARVERIDARVGWSRAVVRLVGRECSAVLAWMTLAPGRRVLRTLSAVRVLRSL